ncbi:MAG: 50S ribosomal protein L32 [Eubacteriales bacterium]|nr:50S ribosomal protein L32 [Eubacteriales bacterium]MDD4476220.1 50S ribosomal protein L32 [Eubacteriales bacterium]
MAVPKRKTSKARRDKRRSSVWKLDAPSMTKCSKCGEFVLTHRVCTACGTYRGKLIIKPKPEKKEA